MKLPKLETKYRSLTDPKLSTLWRMQGVEYTVQYKEWWNPVWRTIGKANNAEEITRLVNLHKKRVNYL